MNLADADSFTFAATFGGVPGELIVACGANRRDWRAEFFTEHGITRTVTGKWITPQAALDRAIFVGVDIGPRGDTESFRDADGRVVEAVCFRGSSSQIVALGRWLDGERYETPRLATRDIRPMSTVLEGDEVTVEPGEWIVRESLTFKKFDAETRHGQYLWMRNF